MPDDKAPLDVNAVERALTSGRGGPETWNPPDCGDIDMRIAADGTWFYQGSPIGRPALVKLFASVLRREGERYVLVTPVEKLGIRVEDAPFLAVALAAEGEGGARRLIFRTHLDETVVAGPAHPLRFVRDGHDAPRPYLTVRPGIEARVVRSVFYDLVALGEVRIIGGGEQFGVASDGAFFAMAPAAEVAAGLPDPGP